jgi:hypothetical protein
MGMNAIVLISGHSFTAIAPSFFTALEYLQRAPHPDKDNVKSDKGHDAWRNPGSLLQNHIDDDVISSARDRCAG